MGKLVAITGGIGSGKSAVLRIISSFGLPVISADDVNRELLQSQEYLNTLSNVFPEAFDDGVFDKKKLANIIFHDDNERQKLNTIAHSHIRKLIDKHIEEINANMIFIEVPLLIESGMTDMFDDIIVVTADKDVKIDRVMKRDNMSREEVLSRMAVQLNDKALIAIATHVIENNSTYNALEEKVKIIVDNL